MLGDTRLGRCFESCRSRTLFVVVECVLVYPLPHRGKILRTDILVKQVSDAIVMSSLVKICR